MKFVRYCALFLLTSAPLCKADDRTNLALKGTGNALFALGSSYVALQMAVQGAKDGMKSVTEISNRIPKAKTAHLFTPKADEASYRLGKHVLYPGALAAAIYITGKTAYNRTLIAYDLLKKAYNGEEAV